MGVCLALGPASGAGAGQVFSNATAACGLEVALSDWESLYFEYPIWSVVFKGGGAVGDFNNDGWQDIFVTPGPNNRGATDKLYINNGDGTFSDRSAEAGVALAHYGTGAAVGDYNNDGWLDIFVLSQGPIDAAPVAGAHILYRNNGDGTFTNVAVQAGVNSTGTWTDGFGAAFGDYDLDGHLDLAVTGYYAPFSDDIGGNRLFRNNGDGTFTDVTLTAILCDLKTSRGYSPAFVDMDGDRYPELLWVSDFWTSRYLVNNRDGTFSEATQSAGVGLDSNGMGMAVGDLDDDGLLDWYVTSIYGSIGGSGNVLYRNLGSHRYAEISAAAGVSDGGWGWGTSAVDVNHDGRLDLVATNGFVQPKWLTDPTRVFLNNGDGTFTDSAAALGLVHTGQGRGLVNVDYDNDGDQDIIIFGMDLSIQLFRNDLTGPDVNWLRVFLDASGGAKLAPDGYGARVTATVGGVSRLRVIHGACHYMAVSELSAHFGLGAAEQVDELRIEWPNGTTTTLANVAANQTLTIRALAPDFNGDCAVDQSDLGILLAKYGCTGAAPIPPAPSDCAGDADLDGDTDQADLGLLLSVYGHSCLAP